MCQSRARAPLVLVAGGGSGGADAARTPLADSPRAMQATLDTLFEASERSAARQDRQDRDPCGLLS